MYYLLFIILTGIIATARELGSIMKNVNFFKDTRCI